MRRVTIRDVAASAGVAPSTVSAVLNQSVPTSGDVRRRVLEAVRTLGYEPDHNARNLARQRAQAIGLVIPDTENAFFAVLAGGLDAAVGDDGFSVLLHTARYEDSREQDLVRLARSRRLDGIVYIAGTSTATGALNELARSAPVVVVDERTSGLNVPFVGAENRRGARLAAEAALAFGHRRVGIVTGPTALWTAEQRLAGYREGLARAGVDPDGVPSFTGDYRVESGIAAAEALLSGPRESRPTALLVSNDLMAIGCLRWCFSAGISVPHDVSVVGFDDIPLARHFVPALTTVRQPAQEIGAAAGRLLLQLLRDEQPDAVSELPTTLVTRESLMEAP
ncbi:LacI family DNA-binding transcriptional regulator [Conexibacter sp. CPCC 206217]|uniref:LacI family DNA-binding transcriptional regulator n=1 Tax=Conexibacter sp. CPCC 206217 TaxID=3064574 RepID=UPI00271C58A0|nr:LacI family DNA-binding transcriptional regulator [Conexibacter sp. CPCC 206217]MDO8208845.1 LacI family DNA-binding transcriptional regulator [Conexibacter sp. CPCC 206217]